VKIGQKDKIRYVKTLIPKLFLWSPINCDINEVRVEIERKAGERTSSWV
jgi:hypothetical protein